ncbi:MAG: LysR family transcriptional regulator, partial [Clostridia bacterium]|nr:LysR family transcriptional regulator [Clostridia bacterium]
AENGSFTKAAVQHYISQTAITQQVHALEEKIGAKLVNRNSRPITLTPAGKVFLSEARAILDRMDVALWRTREATTGLVGTLRVGYTKGYEHSNLASHLRNFRREYPNILFTCFRCDTDTLAAGLLNEDYDIIFTWDSTNIRREESLQMRVMEHVPLHVALYANHPLARRNELTRKDLKQERILFMSPSGTGDSFGDSHYIQLYQRAGYQPDILIRSSDMESILMMVAGEEGISIVPEYCKTWDVGMDNVVYVPLSGEGETEEILVVWRKDDDNPALHHFIDRLEL